jgi:hypothetical protein
VENGQILSNFPPKNKNKSPDFYHSFKEVAIKLILNKRAFIHPENWSQDQTEGSIEKTTKKKQKTKQNKTKS